MKILFIVVGDFSPVSGVGKTSFSLARHLAQEYDLTVFASGGGEEIPGRVRFHRIPFWQTEKLWEFLLPLPTIWNFLLTSYLCVGQKNAYDVIHVFNGLTWFKKALITLQICQKGAFRHQAGDSSWSRIKKKSPKHQMILFLEWLVYRWNLFRKLVVCSEFEKSEIIRYYRVPSEKIKVLYNGMDMPSASPAEISRTKNATRGELGYSKRDKVLLFVGYDLKRKGLEYAIRALPHLPREFKLLVVGGQDQSGSYGRMSSELLVADRVQFSGPYADISPFYAAADIFIFPTLYEPFGTAILEAMSWGLPVVTSAGAGAAELITSGQEGFLLQDPRDHEEIARLARRIVEEELGPAMGDAGRQTAGKCTWKERARELEGIYRVKPASPRRAFAGR